MRLPQTYRSLSRPSSALDAKAFPLRSYQLDRNADLCRSATGSHQELCRLQIRFIVVLCYPFKKSTKVYFVTSLLLARNFLLAFTVQFSRCRPLILFQDQIEMLGRLPKHFNLFLVEVTGLEPVTPCLQSKCLPAELNPQRRATFSAENEAASRRAHLQRGTSPPLRNPLVSDGVFVPRLLTT